MDSILSFVPLAVVVLLVVGVVSFLRRRKKLETPGPNGELPYGMGGWLAFFWFASVFLAPLFTLGTLLKSFREALAAAPGLAETPAWHSYTSVAYTVVAVTVLWQWFVAYRLKTRFEPSSVRHAQAFLLLSPLLSTSIDFMAASHYFDVPIQLNAEIVRDIVRAGVASLVWFCYFTVSKRVKNTYFSSPTRPSSPALSPGQVA